MRDIYPFHLSELIGHIIISIKPNETNDKLSIITDIGEFVYFCDEGTTIKEIFQFEKIKRKVIDDTDGFAIGTACSNLACDVYAVQTYCLKAYPKENFCCINLENKIKNRGGRGRLTLESYVRHKERMRV